jgi:hypothetical protein
MRKVNAIELSGCGSRPADGFVGFVDGFQRAGHVVVIIGHSQQHTPCFVIPILLSNNPQFLGVDAISVGCFEFFTHYWPTPANKESTAGFPQQDN